MSRETYISKETCLYEKRPAYFKIDLPVGSEVCEICQERHIYQKRHTCTRRDLHIFQKRPACCV